MAVPTSIKLDDSLKSRLKRLAEARRRSTHWIMREAIEQYVAHEEKRESFKQDALNAWQQYQRTGKHLTGEEARAWLNTWGTPDEKAVPGCHK